MSDVIQLGFALVIFIALFLAIFISGVMVGEMGWNFFKKLQSRRNVRRRDAEMQRQLDAANAEMQRQLDAANETIKRYQAERRRYR